MCTNTDSSFTCTCKSGFSGDGTFCTCEFLIMSRCGLKTLWATLNRRIPYLALQIDLSSNRLHKQELFLGTKTLQFHILFTTSHIYIYILILSRNIFLTNFSVIDTTDIDECTLFDSPCHSNATCNNTVGSFQCTCNNGFSGNGIICTGTKIYKYY